MSVERRVPAATFLADRARELSATLSGHQAAPIAFAVHQLLCRRGLAHEQGGTALPPSWDQHAGAGLFVFVFSTDRQQQVQTECKLVAMGESVVVHACRVGGQAGVASFEARVGDLVPAPAPAPGVFLERPRAWQELDERVGRLLLAVRGVRLGGLASIASDAGPVLHGKSDAAMFAVHCALVNHHSLRCTHVDDVAVSSGNTPQHACALPEGWNSQPDHQPKDAFALKYDGSAGTLVVKGVVLGRSLLVHALLEGQAEPLTVEIECDDVVGTCTDLSDFAEVFPEAKWAVAKEAAAQLVPKPSAARPAAPRRDDWREDQRAQPSWMQGGHGGVRPSPHHEVGRDDRLPFGGVGVGGGSLVGPGHPMFSGGVPAFGGGMGGGGAGRGRGGRFLPTSPFAPHPSGFGEPDFDHFRMPRGDDDHII